MEKTFRMTRELLLFLFTPSMRPFSQHASPVDKQADVSVAGPVLRSTH